MKFAYTYIPVENLIIATGGSSKKDWVTLIKRRLTEELITSEGNRGVK